MIITKVNTLGTITCAINTIPNPINQGINNPCAHLAPSTFNRYSVRDEFTGETPKNGNGVVVSSNQSKTTNQ